MKVSCNIIKDLIPLYVEDMVSEDSVQLIETHLEHCEDCRKLLEELNQPYTTPEDHNAMPLMKMKTVLRKKKILTVALTLVMTLLFSAVLFAFLTAPSYLPYVEENVQVSEQADGTVTVSFSDQVSGYDVNRYPSEEGSGMSYSLTTYTTLWEEHVLSKDRETIVLNEGDEPVSSVYYYQTDGSEDQLIYGDDENPNGFTVTLPRLNLSYYLFFAVLFGGLCLVAALLFRRHKEIVLGLYKLFLLSVSYVLAHLTVMGLSSASFSSARDLLAIIVITIPLYAMILLGIKLFSIRREHRQIEKLN